MSLDRRFKVDQEDGAVWQIFHAGDNPHKYTVFTSAGREVMLHDPSFKPLLRQYSAVAIGKSVDEPGPEVRKYLGHGKQATVFTMGKRFAVRETHGVDTFYGGIGEMQKMNVITSLIDQGTPRWLRSPEHFVRISDPVDTNTVYTVMRRVNDGVTVEDIVMYPDTVRADAVDRHYRQVTDETRETALRLFDRAHNILSTLIEKGNNDPSQILTDWEHRNVLIRPISTPVAGERHILEVIDQY